MTAQAELESHDEITALIESSLAISGRLDMVVANAASGAFRPVLASERHHVSRTMETVVGSFVTIAGLVVHHMPHGGRIVAISGLDAHMAQPGHGVLGAAKAELEALVRSLAVDSDRSGSP